MDVSYSTVEYWIIGHPHLLYKVTNELLSPQLPRHWSFNYTLLSLHYSMVAMDEIDKT